MFKVGDYATIRADFTREDADKEVGYASCMEKYRGKTFQIETVSRDGKSITFKNGDGQCYYGANMLVQPFQTQEEAFDALIKGTIDINAYNTWVDRSASS
jgi:hypothetical protein